MACRTYGRGASGQSVTPRAPYQSCAGPSWLGSGGGAASSFCNGQLQPSVLLGVDQRFRRDVAIHGDAPSGSSIPSKALFRLEIGRPGGTLDNRWGHKCLRSKWQRRGLAVGCRGFPSQIISSDSNSGAVSRYSARLESVCVGGGRAPGGQRKTESNPRFRPCASQPTKAEAGGNLTSQHRCAPGSRRPPMRLGIEWGRDS